jgi:hypothetical protein
LWDAGPALPGPAPLTHQEIESWQRLVRVDLKPWEVQFLKRLSAEYVAELARGQKLDARPPWQTAVTAADKRAAALSMRDSIRNMAAAR